MVAVEKPGQVAPPQGHINGPRAWPRFILEGLPGVDRVPGCAPAYVFTSQPQRAGWRGGPRAISDGSQALARAVQRGVPPSTVPAVRAGSGGRRTDVPRNSRAPNRRGNLPTMCAEADARAASRKSATLAAIAAGVGSNLRGQRFRNFPEAQEGQQHTSKCSAKRRKQPGPSCEPRNNQCPFSSTNSGPPAARVKANLKPGYPPFVDLDAVSERASVRINIQAASLRVNMLDPPAGSPPERIPSDIPSGLPLRTNILPLHHCFVQSAWQLSEAEGVERRLATTRDGRPPGGFRQRP